MPVVLCPFDEQNSDKIKNLEGISYLNIIGKEYSKKQES
jgi:hypothetical protein